MVLWRGINVTARDLINLFLRRWYLVAIGAVVTLSAMYATLHHPGVYWTKLTVVLLAPAEEYYPNKIRDPRHQLAPLAGLVVTEWNKDHQPTLTGSADTTIFGEGKRDDVQVRMPNQGSQWKPLYVSPNIDVQVVGSNPAEVEARAIEVSDELDRILLQVQADLGVHKTVRVTSLQTPAVPTVAYMNGSPPRALLATALAGALITFAAIYWLERWKPGWRLVFWRRSTTLPRRAPLAPKSTTVECKLQPRGTP